MAVAGSMRHCPHLYRVCWTSILGQGAGQSVPMSREIAEFVARDEALSNDMKRFWVECCDDQDDARQPLDS